MSIPTRKSIGPWRSQGVTLIELMIVVVIVSILASIAIPSYSQYVLRGHRNNMKTQLAAFATRQEARLADRRSYAADLTLLGLPAAGTSSAPLYMDGNTNLSSSASNARYAVTFSGTPTATTYTLQAVPQGAQASDTRCGTLTITSTGTRSASGSDGGPSCWGR